MKALTLWQPWASLMAHGHKKAETRCWATRYRGLVAIHSALKKPNWLGASCETQEFKAAWRKATKMMPLAIHPLPFGCVLAIGNLVAVEPTEGVRDDLSEQERIFGNYEDGRYAWFFEDITRLKAPIFCKGNRLLWNLDEEILWTAGELAPEGARRGESCLR